MIAKIIAYKGKIICWPQQIKPGHGFTPTQSKKGVLGCVIADTAKNLGVSKEAFALMKKIRRNRDAIGDIGWWECADKTHAFSWFGGLFRVIDPKDAEGDRDFILSDNMPCIDIPNDPPEGLNKALKDEKLKAWSIWNTPFATDLDLPEKAK